MDILHRNDLPLGGFAGLKEHRLVTDRRTWGDHAEEGAWDGIGQFIYLADARFNPHGQTMMHGHREVDVISVMVEGRIAHEGSLEHGEMLHAGDVQVQRAGGEGFRHNEVNPDGEINRMIQIWFAPDRPGEPAGYQVHHPESGAINRVYGGSPNQPETFDSSTTMDVALPRAGQEMEFEGPLMAYVTKGSGVANGLPINDGDLVRTDGLQLKADEDMQLVVIR